MSALVLDQIGIFVRLRKMIDLAGGASRFAKAHKLTPGQVSEALSGRSFGPRILKALGAEKEVTVRYVIKGSNTI